MSRRGIQTRRREAEIYLKVFLGGALQSNGLMRTTLQAQGLIPALNGNAVPPNTEIVDWVQVKIFDPRYGNYKGGTVRLTYDAFVLANGSVVGPDGKSPLKSLPIYNVANYTIGIFHRNHLPVFCTGYSNGASKRGKPIVYDFTTAQEQAWQDWNLTDFPAQMPYDAGGKTVYCMWPGDADGDGKAVYSDENAAIMARTNNGTFVATGYFNEDINLNGSVRASGAPAVNDLSLISAITNGGTKNVYAHDPFPVKTPPQNVIVSNVTQNSFEIRWDAVPHADSVQLTVTGPNSTAISSMTTQSQSETIKNLPANTVLNVAIWGITALQDGPAQTLTVQTLP